MALNNQIVVLSIVVNNYNYGRFLNDCIDSCLSQLQDRVEVVVVDDGSSDNSRQVIDSYGDRVRAVYKANGGQASAFNAGFAAAVGDWIYFLDSDDFLLPGAIGAILAATTEGTSKIHFPLKEFAENAGFTGKLIEGGGLSEGDVTQEIAKTGHHRWPPTSGNVFSRNFLKQCVPVPEEEYRISADLYLNTRAPFFGRIKAVKTPMAAYRRHNSNLYAAQNNSALGFIKNSHWVSKAISDLQTLLKESNTYFDPNVFIRREVVAAQIVCIRFVTKPGHMARSVMQLLITFFLSTSFRLANFKQKCAWSIFVLGCAILPKSGVISLINRRRALPPKR